MSTIKKYINPKTSKKTLLEDFLGLVFNRLEITEILPRENHSNGKKKPPKILAKCECGIVKKYYFFHVVYNKTHSCGCYNKELFWKNLKPNYSKKDGMSNKIGLFNQYKSRAIYGQHEFNLTFNDFIEITSQNCDYCGIEPRQICKSKTVDLPYIYNGIDRVDSIKHYTKDNCVPCCKVCNRAKNDLSINDFKSWLERIYTHTITRDKNVIRPEN